MLTYFLIAQNDSILDIMMNFLALGVLIEIDNSFFTSHEDNDLLKSIVENEDSKYDLLL